MLEYSQSIKLLSAGLPSWVTTSFLQNRKAHGNARRKHVALVSESQTQYLHWFANMLQIPDTFIFLCRHPTGRAKYQVLVFVVLRQCEIMMLLFMGMSFGRDGGFSANKMTFLWICFPNDAKVGGHRY